MILGSWLFPRDKHQLQVKVVGQEYAMLENDISATPNSLIKI
jgi:hypothetical protein